MTALEAHTRADQYEAAEDRGRRLREECHTPYQMACLLGYLVEALAADTEFSTAVDKYLDDTRPQRREVFPVCPSCGQHGGHTLTCALRPPVLTDDWIPVLHEVTIGSQPDVIVSPAGRLEHFRPVTA